MTFTEAQYASHRNVPIIPLKYEEDFNASDWLGLLISSTLYYDVHSDESLMRNLPDIKKALDIHYKLDKPEEAVIDSAPTGAL